MAYKRGQSQAQEQWARRNYAIKNALTPAEKALISFYEINYTLRQGYIPTIDEVYEHLRKKYPKIRQTSVSYYLNRQPVIKALESRGIPFRQHSQEELTDKQYAVALTMSNFADERSNAEKLDELGVNSATYYAWLQDPNFQRYVKTLADRNLQHIDPVAKTEFAKKIQEGHWPAIKHYLDVTGTLQQDSMPESEVLMRMLIEIIQKHVKDPNIIMAIAKDVKLASANRTLELAAYDVRDETQSFEEPEVDLATAKKMLGYG